MEEILTYRHMQTRQKKGTWDKIFRKVNVKGPEHNLFPLLRIQDPVNSFFPHPGPMLTVDANEAMHMFVRTFKNCPEGGNIR